ncbi:sensor histidine kinase [Candidatus Sulfurimonas baltica]|uniref:histidine kinase n=1 Tax=Candidatus Sulfurimonas baltica TaxID=2740404 RepID=A0A7S7RML7_9BACT|nr:ATP-binding protein [Candidatus Sulfurimonas baltica]QOY51611.1 PAS domain-containing protein [Candidatus Sulfurimonas baltica]
MSEFRRYGILFIFSILFYVPTSLFINHVYSISLEKYIEHERVSKKNIFDLLNVKHPENYKGMENLLIEMQEILKDKYMLVYFEKNSPNIFDSDILGVLNDKIDKKQQIEISNKIKDKDIFVDKVNIDKLWYFLTFIKMNNTQRYIVSLSISNEVVDLEKNKQISHIMLLVVLLTMLILLNVALKHTQKIKKLNKTLSENLERLQTVLDAVPLPIFVKNKQNVYIECNNAYAGLTNADKNEIVNKKTDDILPEYLANVHAKKDLELLSCDNIHYKEIYNSRGNKTVIYEFFKTVIKKDGKYNGYICAMVNVTRHEEQEAYLERRVGELVPLLNNEVIKNMTLAKEHEEARMRDVKFSVIGQLSAGITHEINTPLTYIKGNVEMMKMDLEDLEDSTAKKNLLEDFVHVSSGVAKIATIIESMREMSQHTKESSEVVNIYNTIAVSLVMAYNRSKYISKIYLNKKEFNLSFNMKEFVFLSNVQEQRIEQVWVVMVNNALDELQKKESYDDRELFIDCKEEDENIIVTFKDNAGGIDAEILNNIFEPFVSSKPQGGMGIGLSIAKKIVLDQKGDIDAYNDKDGAIFKITLPKA